MMPTTNNYAATDAELTFGNDSVENILQLIGCDLHVLRRSMMRRCWNSSIFFETFFFFLKKKKKITYIPGYLLKNCSELLVLLALLPC